MKSWGNNGMLLSNVNPAHGPVGQLVNLPSLLHQKTILPSYLMSTRKWVRKRQADTSFLKTVFWSKVTALLQRRPQYILSIIYSLIFTSSAGLSLVLINRVQQKAWKPGPTWPLDSGVLRALNTFVAHSNVSTPFNPKQTKMNFHVKEKNVAFIK